MKVSLKDRHGCAECPIRAAIDKPGCSAEDAEHRLQMFADLGLLEIRDNPSLDRIVNLASKALKAPVSLVSLIAEDRQVFVAQLGLCSPWREQGQTPLSHSFCQYVVATNKVLRVEDARLDPCLKSNGAIKDLGVVAYLGAPLRLDCGVTLGALCLIEPHPRVWTDDDEALLQDYAALVVQEIELRRIARLEMQKGEAIQEKTTQFELALSHMAHGLSFFDRDGRLINANAEYSAIYRLDPAALQPGTTIQAIMDMRRAIGTNTKLADSEYLAWVGSAQVGEPLRREFELVDGRIIRVFCRATAGGGWVATNEDITDRKRLHNEVETRERLYRLLAENTNDVVILAEVKGARRYFSPAVSRLLGYSPEEASHISMREWIHPNDLDSVFRTTASLTLDTPVSSVIYRLRHKDGHYLWAEAVFRLFKDEEEQLQIVATVRDVSLRKEAEAEYRDLFANANVGLFRMNLDGGLLRANEALAQLCGYGSVEMLLSAARRQSQEDELPLDTKEIARRVRSEGELRKFIRMTRRADTGEMVYLMHSAWMVPPKQHMAGAIEGSVLDITDRIRHEQSVRHLAQHDPLTGLPNRAFFQQEVNRNADAKESNVTIAYLDLDLFKNVNDQYGHGAGDECLIEIGRRLLSLAVDSDAFIARLGGDEFAILFVASPPSATEAFVLSVIEAIQRPVVLSVGDDVRLGVSVGLATFDAADGIDASEALRRADLAMYAAKAAGRSGFAWFDHRLDEIRKRRTQLDRDLRLALERDELFLVFQPQFDLEGGRLEGFEALLRWHHPVQGLVPPSEFIPVAEANGLIRPIGRWVMARACEFAAKLIRNTKVSVNVSALQFKDPDFVSFVLQTVQALGLERRTIEVELTESILLESDPCFQAMINRLRDNGITIAIDDFGTGYSSLGYLSRFPFDSIKIDRSFISDLNSETSNRILRSIIGLGKSIDKKIIVEGVETIEQLEFLKVFRPVAIQGYLFGRPMRQEQAVDLERRIIGLENYDERNIA